MSKLKSLYNQYREPVTYLIAGVLTTAVNYLSFLLFEWFLSGRPHQTIAATSIAWLVSVIFAYLINRVWVFRSQARGLGPLLREIGAFFAARLFSGVLDVAIMYLAVDRMGLSSKIVKLASNVLVVILNYIFSKLFIFRKSPN